MRNCTSVAVALAFAAAFTTAADAAVEFTFMQSTQLSHDRVVSYTPGPVSTLLISSSTKSSNPSQAVGLTMFKAPFGPGFEIFLPVDMTLWATSSAPVVDTGIQFEQTGFSGSLSYSWWDPVGMVTVNLLTATFMNATLNVDFGQTPSGSFFSTLPSQSISYTSDVFAVENAIEADFALAFSSISAAFVPKSGVGTAFQANVVGTFAAAIPEPGTWAMMIAGFGLVGFAARRRGLLAAAA